MKISNIQWIAEVRKFIHTPSTLQFLTLISYISKNPFGWRNLNLYYSLYHTKFYFRKEVGRYQIDTTIVICAIVPMLLSFVPITMSPGAPKEQNLGEASKWETMWKRHLWTYGSSLRAPRNNWVRFSPKRDCWFYVSWEGKRQRERYRWLCLAWPPFVSHQLRKSGETSWHL